MEINSKKKGSVNEPKIERLKSDNKQETDSV